MKLYSTLAGVALLVLATQSGFAEPVKIKVVEERPVVQFPDGTPGRIVRLKTVKARFDNAPARIGELQEGWLCSRRGDIVWQDRTYKLFSSKLGSVFRAETEKAHYPAPVLSDALFEQAKDKTAPKPELQVGALIKEVAVNMCAKSTTVLGGSYMKIFWQVFAPDTQTVVFETTTEGSFQTGDSEGVPVDQMFLRSFEAATRNLFAERGFYSAVANTALGEVKPNSAAQGAPIALKRVKLSGESVAKNITGLRSAVATIVADTGTGSGFFVSPDGYLVTNYHVVGTTRFVKVKLATGRELLGEVVRSDKARDVALIKTEPIAVPALAIRETEPGIGEEVYALGSPLSDAFNTTLTRGVLSGYRTLNDVRFLQSDVAILPGNSGGPLLDAQGAVIGVTVARLLLNNGQGGLNFFIPVGEALAKLGLAIN